MSTGPGGERCVSGSPGIAESGCGLGAGPGAVGVCAPPARGASGGICGGGWVFFSFFWAWLRVSEGVFAVPQVGVSGEWSSVGMAGLEQPPHRAERAGYGMDGMAWALHALSWEGVCARRRVWEAHRHAWLSVCAWERGQTGGRGISPPPPAAPPLSLSPSPLVLLAQVWRDVSDLHGLPDRTRKPGRRCHAFRVVSSAFPFILPPLPTTIELAFVSSSLSFSPSAVLANSPPSPFPSLDGVCHRGRPCPFWLKG